MSRTMKERQGKLKGKVIPPQAAPVWNPEARVTMDSDMPAETCYHAMELLSDPLRPKREASRQIIEHENRDNWSRAYGLWGRHDSRPKVSAKRKRAIVTRTRPLDLHHMQTTSQLDVQISAGSSTSSNEATTQGRPISEQTTQGEHTQEVATPVPVEDPIDEEGPKTPEAADTPNSQGAVIL